MRSDTSKYTFPAPDTASIAAAARRLRSGRGIAKATPATSRLRRCPGTTSAPAAMQDHVSGGAHEPAAPLASGIAASGPPSSPSRSSAQDDEQDVHRPDEDLLHADEAGQGPRGRVPQDRPEPGRRVLVQPPEAVPPR